jgi:hypothetical protein
VRYTLDETEPEADVGFQLKAGDPPLIIPVGAAGINVIEEAEGATIQYQWGELLRVGGQPLFQSIAAPLGIGE